MKSKIITTLVKIVFWTVGHMPRPLIVFKGKCIGKFLHMIGFKKDRIVRNLNQVYGSKENWPKNILSRIYRHFGLLLIEILKMPSVSQETVKEMTTFDGLEHLDKALSHNQGVIMVSGHTGNWECTMASLVGLGYDLHVVVKRLKHVDNDYIFGQLRESKGIKTIFKDKAVLNIRRALKKNAICLLVMDQNSKRSDGVFVDHFGKKASTFAAPYVLAKRFKCPVVPAFSYRSDDLVNHRAEFLPSVKFIECENPDEEVETNVRELIKPFEEFLLKHPEQWIWMHQRWRTQPK
ncbi:MAG: lysophospholipid acyltransferase family protein [Lentisphaeraceae bacterium]|nr:lysophospholipid acyltransferase family protein [Lentisphaeraceae bacterium]